MYHPTTRVLTVLELLQSQGHVTGPDLAERLEVNVRTARRYVTMLQDLGIPVEAERGRHGGYRLRPGFKLPPLMLTDEEALAVTLGLLLARRMGMTATAPASEGALAKIERVLPDALREQVQAVQQMLAMAVSPSDAASTELLAALSLAAHRGRSVRLRYAGRQREETDRVIDPYGVAFYAPRWYVAGWCHLRTDLRLFRLDRIQEITTIEHRFKPPREFDTLGFVAQSLASMPGAWTVEILLHVPIESAAQIIPRTHGTLTPVEGGTLYRRTTDNLDWFARGLVRLEMPLTVISPPELKTRLRVLAREVERMAGVGNRESGIGAG
ncbi:MAG TPA: YafY family protein [Thermomicrobiales bacterium]|nr:YafY family protein [Thermomicrobiales bacterium]